MMLCEVYLAMCHTNLLLNSQATFFFFFFKFASLRHHKVQNCLRLDSYKLHFVVIFLKDQNVVCNGDGEISNLNHNKIYQCQQIFILSSRIICFRRVVLCIVEFLAEFLASTHQMPVPYPSYNKLNQVSRHCQMSPEG